jgi:methylmalonyl-CoA mutase
MDKEKLFTAFPPVETTSWLEKIKADLKGADFEKKLVWHTDDGFDVQPFYRADDLKQMEHLQSPPGTYPFVRGNQLWGNRWKVNQLVLVSDATTANREALEAIGKGADALSFQLDRHINEQIFKQLLDGIDAEKTALNFKTPQSEQLINLFLSLARQKKWDLNKIKGSVFCDPLAGNVKQEAGDSLLATLIETSRQLPAFHVIGVDATVFHNSGATIVSEIAFGLARGSAYMQTLTDKGFDAKFVAEKMRFCFATGSNYFMEIAKFRALRYLWAKILTAFGVEENDARIYLHAINSKWNKSLYDPYVNMLRTTTEAMSAILGGVDELTTLPFDLVLGNDSEMGKRIARNQQLILKKESFFDKVADPAAGSYYIEVLTDKLIHQAWSLFLEVDKKGGYENALRQGFISEKIAREAEKKNQDIAKRKRSLLGINQFPNTTEHIRQNLPDEVFEMPDSGDGLKTYRAAAPFEALRYQTDRYAQKHPRPVVFLFPYGNVAMSRARAQFAANFFGCAGYQISDHSTFSSVKEGMALLEKEQARIVVFCGADDEYDQWVFDAVKMMGNQHLPVLAGYPEKLLDAFRQAGISHFVHSRCNVLTTLKQYQKLMGIDGSAI